MNLILDAKNLVFRAGVIGDLTDSKGRHAGMVYNTLRMVRSLVHKLNPDRVIVCWDGGKSKRRLRVYPKYKYREPGSVVKDTQLGMFLNSLAIQTTELRRRVFPLLPVLQLRLQGVECDDIIVCAVQLLSRAGEQSLIISTDKDFYQLLHLDASVYHTALEEPYTAAHFQKEYGFASDRWLEYRALVGDKSDNIPGVKGIGPKTATKIIQAGGVERYLEANKDLDIYAVRQLRDGQEVYTRNLQLVSTTDEEIEQIFEPFVGGLEGFSPALQTEELEEYFQEVGFVSLLSEFGKWQIPFKNLV